MALDPQLALPIGAVVTVMGGVWLTGLRMGTVEAKLEAHSKDIDRIQELFKCISAIQSSVARIEGRLGCTKCEDEKD